MALQADQGNDQAFSDVRNPELEYISHIPKCSEDLYIGNKECTELLYSPNNALAQVSGATGGSGGEDCRVCGAPRPRGFCWWELRRVPLPHARTPLTCYGLTMSTCADDHERRRGQQQEQGW